MAWIHAILICCGITASVQALPAITKELETDSIPDLKITNQYFQPLQQPLTKLEKDETTKHPIQIVEFIYQDQDNTAKIRKGTERELYMHNLNSIETDNAKQNTTENIKDLYSKEDITKNKNTNKSTITAILKKTSYFTKTHQKQDEWLLFPKEVSSITGNPPQFLFHILSISPFPDEISETQEQKGTDTLKKDMLKKILSPMTEQTSRPLQQAGPLLYPQSTYAREFDLPFFD